MSQPRKKIRYSPKIARAVLDRIAAGESLRSICRDSDMPGFSTVLEWANKDTDGFRNRYAVAMDFRAQGMFDEMLEIADTIEPGKRMKKSDLRGTEIIIGDMIERAKLRVDARKWMLARMAPKRYGEKITQEISGPDGGPVRTEGEYRITPDDEAALHRIADIRARLTQDQLNPDQTS